MKQLYKSWLCNWPILTLALLLVGSSCREEDPAPDNAIIEANAKVNSWILENMEFWYFWAHELPGSPDKNLEPDEFFQSLLSDEDRFSWIQDNYQELLNSLQGISKEAGYEYVLYKDPDNSNNVIGVILYIKPGSPAETAGLKRGDKFTHINNTQLTTANYQEVMPEIREDHTLTFTPKIADQEAFGSEQTVSLSAVQFAENPHHLSKVIEIDEKKVGYYVYNFFANGTDTNPNIYDNEMEDIFEDFKSAGITDLVLDLRFNSGGSESAANSLASHIGKTIDATKVFARRQYNPGVEEAIIDDPDLGPEFLVTKFLNKPFNIGNALSGGRVYILTSSRTASASELVINALKPFMEVFLIGDVTYGKNVGSISIFDDEDPDNTWGMQPIVVKVFNSLDESNYSNGFTPDVEDKDNRLFIEPLGDPDEALLAQAIGQITGTAQTGRIMPGGESREIISHSLDEKRRSFNLVIDQPHGSTILRP